MLTRLSRKLFFSGMVGVVVGMLSGCISVPDTLTGTTPTPQQNLLIVQQAPQLFIGQEARFGGRVVNVVNERDHTRLEITSMPLDAGARPALGAASQGRFFADVTGFLEPSDFRNALVTVVGPITGIEKGNIGQVPYNFVVIRVITFQRWRIEQQVITPPNPCMWSGPWSGPGPRDRRYWGPDWNCGPPMPGRIQNIVTP